MSRMRGMSVASVAILVAVEGDLKLAGTLRIEGDRVAPGSYRLFKVAGATTGAFERI